MNNYYPLVGIPSDVKVCGVNAIHGVGEKYINAVAHGSSVCPILIPAQGPGEDLEPMDEQCLVNRYLSLMDGLFLSGSASNVKPDLYGDEASLTPDFHDPQRDSITMAMINGAIEQKMPILGVCRGFQELNVAFGGTLYQKVHLEQGMMDHREDETLDREGQYQDVHDIELVPGGILSNLMGSSTHFVNSLHGQAVKKLGKGLVEEAHAPDGLIEAFRMDSSEQYVLAIQWHPEWRYHEKPLSRAIFKSFGDAVRNFSTSKCALSA